MDISGVKGLLLLVTTIAGNAVKNTDDDKRFALFADLFKNYRQQIRPVRNWTDAVKVGIGLSLNQILELDERNQILKGQTWLNIRWTDEFLTWEPAEYGGVEDIGVKLEDIWRPDIVIYNNVDQERTAFEVIPLGVVAVSHAGLVEWDAPVVMQTMCKITVEYYPFDEQICPIKFGSWAYSGLKIDLFNLSAEINLKSLIPSVEWKVSESPCERNVVKYNCCPEVYPDVTCYVRMRRRPEFYLFNFVFPCVLLIAIALLVFCLPSESGEKVSLAITVLLSMTVFMLLVMENIPANSETIPLLEKFIGCTIALLSLSTALAVWVLNVHFRGASYGRPPYWLRLLILKWGSYLVCMHRRVKDATTELEDGLFSRLQGDQHAHACENGSVALVSVLPRPVSEANKNGQNKTQSVGSPQQNSTGKQKEQLHSPRRREKGRETVPLLRSILAELRAQHTYQKYKDKDAQHDSTRETEWALIAVIMDRIFFVLLLLAAVCMSLILFWPVW